MNAVPALQRDSDFTPARRAMVCIAGLAVFAAALPWLYDELDIPYGIRADGYTGRVLCLLAVAGWIALTLRFNVVKDWAERNRRALMGVARVASVGYGAIFVGLFYLMWLLGRVEAGVWPRAYNPDPKELLGSAICYVLICSWAWLLPVAVIFPLARAGLIWRQASVRARLVGLAEVVLTLALMGMAVRWISDDPHRIVRWFLD